MKLITSQFSQEHGQFHAILSTAFCGVIIAAAVFSIPAIGQSATVISAQNNSSTVTPAASSSSNNSSEAEDEDENTENSADTDEEETVVPEKPLPIPPTKTEPATKTPASKPPPAVDANADAAGWHLLTPDYLEDKLQVRFGMGIGGGTKEFSADKLGFSLESTYSPTKKWFGGARFSSLSGVKTDADESYVAQTFLAGAGIEQRFQGSKFLNLLRLRESGFAGLSRLSHLELTSSDSQKSTYGAAFAINFSADFMVWEKCYLFTGMGAQFGNAMWIDAQLGAAAYF
jgi:hypothetical protein